MQKRLFVAPMCVFFPPIKVYQFALPCGAVTSDFVAISPKFVSHRGVTKKSQGSICGVKNVPICDYS